MLRDFATGDQRAVRDLILAGMRERWAEAYDPAANPDLDDMWGSYVDRGAEVVVEELVQRARRRGMLEVLVLTDTPWTSAVELYRSCGFREASEDGVDTHFVLPF